MKEIWKDIKGYEGAYQVSNSGKVRSFLKSSTAHDGLPHVLKPSSTRGYLSVSLFSKESGRKTFLVHRLVAQAFIPNPNNFQEINHKDENKANNFSDNLEWCTRSYNMSYGTARLRQGMSQSKSVEQLNMEGVPIAIYYSIPIAAKINGIDESSIHKCCIGKRNFCGGYMWRFCV